MKRLSVLMAVAFVDMMGLMIIWPLLPLYANNLGASATVVGLLAASFPVAQLVASPVWGYVSDRYGRRPALLVGLGASAFAYVVFGFAHTRSEERRVGKECTTGATTRAITNNIHIHMHT